MTTFAMHASDGLVNAPTSLLFGGVAIAGLAVAAMKARGELDERVAPLAGLVAAFVFAAQMLQFPVLPGVSGHLLGGALAVILAGPWTGALSIGIVVVLQSLLFADGGLTALGVNLTNMALLGTASGYVIAVVLRPIALRSRRGLIVVSFVAAWASTVIAAGGFVVEYAIGGQGAVSMTHFAAALLGVHALIGTGEGVITALTVGAIAAARPDLVHLLGYRRRRAEVVS